MERKKLLIVGPLPNDKYNCQWGGATILMKNFYDYIREKEVRHRFVQTNKYVNSKTLELRPKANLLHFLLHFAAALPCCDTVMFNFSDHGTVHYFPLLSNFAHRLGKKVVLRKFGGSFDIYLKEVEQAKKQRVVNALKDTDLIFFETKASIAHLKTLIGDTDKVHWFPNTRNSPSQLNSPKQFKGRMVFMSHISDVKGVGVLLEAFSRLPDNYTLDFYGAIKEPRYENFDWQSHRVAYKGEISSDEVLKKLNDYDLLLLPTSYREGYPGIIIEALSLGIPVISTQVGGIPEIITSGHEGLLTEPADTDGLVKAILSINDDNYPSFCENALCTFRENFESERTNKHILSILTS